MQQLLIKCWQPFILIPSMFIFFIFFPNNFSSVFTKCDNSVQLLMKCWQPFIGRFVTMAQFSLALHCKIKNGYILHFILKGKKRELFLRMDFELGKVLVAQNYFLMELDSKCCIVILPIIIIIISISIISIILIISIGNIE